MDRILPTACREDSAQLNGFIQEFVAEYQQAWNIESRLYEGVTELLDRLVERQIRLAVLSNKPQAATTRCVEHYLGHYEFAAVLGQHALRPPKPDLTGVREILASLEVAADSCCYVGDTGVDMQTARGAGLYAIGATWGFREAAELLESGAQVLIDHPCDLLPLLGL
jgi:phosphoglycolate phosphatase